MTNLEFLRASFYSKRGMRSDGSEYADHRRLNIAELQGSQWSDEFEKLQRNRLIVGAFRYGTAFQNDPSRKNYNRVASIIKRLELYNETGNTELLVDCANLCMLEFVEGDHPLKHFKAADDGEHMKRAR